MVETRMPKNLMTFQGQVSFELKRLVKNTANPTTTSDKIATTAVDSGNASPLRPNVALTGARGLLVRVHVEQQVTAHCYPMVL